MQIEFTSFILGLLIGGIVAIAFSVPRVGHIIGRVVAVGLLVAGIALLGWAAAAMVSGTEFRPLSWEPFHLTMPIEAIGVGSGLLIGGVTILCLQSCGPRPKKGPGGPGPIRI